MTKCDDLSERQRVIAQLVGRGRTNKEIAATVGVSTKTVEYHLGLIYARLDLTGRSQLRDLVQDDKL